MNLYAFVHNDPLTHFDEYGLWLEPRPPGYFNSLQASQYMMSPLISMYNNPPFQGSMQAFGGMVEAGIGGGLTYGTGGILGALGWPLMAHGLDHTITGMHTAIIGRQRDTVTSQLLQQTGMSSRTAGLVDNGISIIGTMGGAAAMRARQVVTFPSFGLPAAKVSLWNETTINRGAENVNAAVNLAKKLSQLETAQQSAVNIRFLRDGRIRYYDHEILASNPGPTRGRAYVTEFDSNTGRIRGWMECYDHLGIVNRVHPKQINGQDFLFSHYPLTAKELGIYE